MGSTLVTMTAALRAEADKGGGTKDRILGLILHINAGGDPRIPPVGWRATYPMDDPENEPDFWIADREFTTIWCKLDRHPNEAPGLPCSWCGQAHYDDMSVYTFMLPSDY